jgi:6-phosphogluconolactonase
VKIEILPDAESVAQRGAAVLAQEARAAAAARGLFACAVSGGSTPSRMLRALAAAPDVPWDAIHLFQVDERVAPAGDPARNLTGLRESLLQRAPLPEEQLHAMPVEADDLASAAARYAGELARVAGRPPVLDLVHLGLGDDGHTASLVPGDPLLETSDADVGLSEPYRGHRRMTLTFPALNRARRILWLLTGTSKMEVLGRLLRGDSTIPAGRVRRDGAWILADRAAAPPACR